MTAISSRADRLEAYRTAISGAFVPLDASVEDDAPFDASVHSKSIGALSISEIRGTGHVVTRAAREIRTADPEFYKLGLQVRGRSVLSQGGHDEVVTQGHFVLYDTSHPYTLSFDSAYRMQVVMFPRAMLRLPDGPVSEVAVKQISGRRGTAALLPPMLSALNRQAVSPEPLVAGPLGDAVMDLVTAMFAEQLQLQDDVMPETAHRVLLRRIQGFARDNLRDPDLDPAALAAAHHVSLRQLHRLFQAEGTTVGGWIRAERLEGCRRELTDPRQAAAPVSEIASRWGFHNAAHFSRLFREVYGATPSQYRSRGPGLAPAE